MIWMIARREISTRVRTKAFQVLTALMFVGVIGAVIAIALTTGGDDVRDATIGLIGDGAEYENVLSTGSSTIDAQVTVLTTDGRQALEDGDIDVLFDGSAVIWTGRPDTSLDTYVREAVQQHEFGRRATDLGLENSELATLFAEVDLAEERLDGDDSDVGIRAAAAMVSAIATFILLQVWGSLLMLGVVEEKSSRVVEVLLAHISPRTLLAGKILGLGILALAQMSIVVLGLALGLSTVRDVQIPDGIWSLVPLLLLIFILGYAFYATLFAAVGSTVSRQEDAQTAQLPAMLPIFVGYAIALGSISNPDTIVVKIASFVPFTSPVVLPFRIATSNPPAWQIGTSLALLAISVPVMLRVAGAIYRASLLHTGTRIPLTQAFRNRSAQL